MLHRHITKFNLLEFSTKTAMQDGESESRVSTEDRLGWGIPMEWPHNIQRPKASDRWHILLYAIKKRAACIGHQDNFQFKITLIALDKTLANVKSSILSRLENCEDWESDWITRKLNGTAEFLRKPIMYIYATCLFLWVSLRSPCCPGTHRASALPHGCWDYRCASPCLLHRWQLTHWTSIMHKIICTFKYENTFIGITWW
jgi:hypothetical protein